MTERLTIFVDTAKKKTDMNVNLAKTWTHHVRSQCKVEASTTDELNKKEKSTRWNVISQVQDARQDSKIKRVMYIHRNHCQFQYDTTDEASEINRKIR